MRVTEPLAATHDGGSFAAARRAVGAAIAALVTLAAHDGTAASRSKQGCVISGGENRGTISQRCVTVQRKYYLQTRIAADQPKIAVEDIDLFWVHDHDDIYVIGVVAKLFNYDTSPHEISRIAFDRATFTVQARGAWWLQKLDAWPQGAQLIHDNFLRGNDKAYFAVLLPLRFQLKPADGVELATDTPPDIILDAHWSIMTPKAVVSATPRFHGTYSRVISSSEWQSLATARPQIQLEGLPYSPYPAALASTASSNGARDDRDAKRRILVQKIAALWLDRDGVSPEEIAGLKGPPDDWANAKLREYGADFTVHFRLGGAYEIRPRQDSARR